MESKTKSDFASRGLADHGRAGGLGCTGSGDRHPGRPGRAGRDRGHLLGHRRGLQGVCICGALGAAAGAALGRLGPRAARVIGGGIGGGGAGYFALASGEMLPPGTLQWALGGGGYGALFALPVALLVGGLIGLLGAASFSVGIGNATEDGGGPADHGGTDRR